MLNELYQDPRLTRLDKSGRELVLAFAESLGKPSAPTPLVKGWERLAKADPDPSTVHVSTELTDVSFAFMQEENQFAASGAGTVPVERQAGKYNQYNRGDTFRAHPGDARRGPGAESAGGGFKITQGDYSCDVFAWHKDVDEQLMANQAAGDPVLDATQYVMGILRIIRDKTWTTNLFATSLWDEERAGVASGPTGTEFLRWDASGAIPRSDLSAGAVTVHEKTGKWPNTLTVGPHVLRALVLNAEVVDAFKHTTAGAVPSMQALAASLFAPSVTGATPPTIRIAGGIETTSLEGATDALAYIAGKHALLAYVDPNPGIRSQTAYSVFSWVGLEGANAFGIRMKDFELVRNAIPHRVEGEMAFDIQLVSTFLGAFFLDAVS